MRCTPWLVSAALFSTSTTAFYPYHRRTGSEDAKIDTPLPSKDQPHESPTLDIKKRRSRLNKRENKYPVVKAVEPTAPNSLGIHQDGSDYSYFSSVQLGSEKKEMWLLIDTGSPSTWVFGSGCKSEACLKHDTFGKDNSKTLNVSTDTWSVNYGSGDVSGVVANDKVTLAGYDVDLGFGLANVATNEFLTYPMDGILGLGRAIANKMGTSPLMEVMAQGKLLKNNILGVHLSRSADGEADGQITFGAADKAKFKGDLSYTNSVSADGMWEIPCEGAAIDGKDLGLKGKTAIIDTGTSYVLLPPGDAKVLHGKIAGSTNTGETYSLPCDTKSKLEITFSGVTYEISPRDYVGLPDKAGKMCASNIVGHQSFGPDTWLLGDVFLKNVYTVFDFDKDQIGFGTMSGTESASSTKSSSNSSPPSSPETSSSESTAAPTDAEDTMTAGSASTALEGSLPTKTGAPLVTTTGKGTGAVKPQSAQTTASAVADGSGNAMEGGAAAVLHPASMLIVSAASLIIFSILSIF